MEVAILKGLKTIPRIEFEDNILSLDFFGFSRSKAIDANIGIIANFV